MCAALQSVISAPFADTSNAALTHSARSTADSANFIIRHRIGAGSCFGVPLGRLFKLIGSFTLNTIALRI